jgi:mycoredoxin
LAQSVTMYTTTWCGYCKNTKRYLERKGVPFQEIDIEENPEYAERIEKATGGYRTVPTLEIDGRIMVNPSPRELDAVLQG